MKYIVLRIQYWYFWRAKSSYLQYIQYNP